MSPPSSTETTRQPDFAAFRPVNGSSLGHLRIVEPSQVSSSASESRRASAPASHPSDSMSLVKNKTGFLGPSAYSAIYTEHHASLGIDDADANEARSNSPSSTVTPEMIHKGAEVLSLLRDLRTYEAFMGRWFEAGDGLLIIKPLYSIWLSEIQREYEQLLSQHTTLDQLYGLSELVWRNTFPPLREDEGNLSPYQYAMMATGRSLRWESVGLIFSCVGILSASLSDWDSFFAENKDRFVDRSTLTRRMRVAVEACISFCKECEIINALFASLLVSGGLGLMIANDCADPSVV